MKQWMYRGKAKDDKRWVYGALIPSNYNTGQLWISNKDSSRIEIYPWTAGQCTGETLRGQDLYQGDIVEMDHVEPKRMSIGFVEGAFCLCALDKIMSTTYPGKVAFEKGEYVMDLHYIHHSDKEQGTIVGTIHDEVK